MLGRLGVARALALVVLGSGTVLVTAAHGSVRTCGDADQISIRSDEWSRIKAPKLTVGGSALLTYDVARYNADDLAVTNGAAIAVSHDGGCRWRESLLPTPVALPTLPLGESGAVVAQSISQVRFGAFDPRGVWALGHTGVTATDGTPLSQPRVLVSADGGASFVDQSGNLPSGLGRPVAVAATDAQTALLLFHQTAPQPTYEVYATADGGGTWQLLYSGLPALDDLAVDYFRAELLAWGSTGLYSANLAAKPAPATDLTVYQVTSTTMTKSTAVVSPVRTVTLDPFTGETTVYLVDSPARLVSTDGGRSFSRRAAPDTVYSASTGPLPGLTALSTVQTNVLVEPPRGRAFAQAKTTDFSPSNQQVGDVKFVQTISGSRSSPARMTVPLYAMSSQALFRRDVPADLHLPADQPAPSSATVGVRHVAPVRKHPSLVPAGAVVSLRPGQRKTVDYRLGLAPNPTPLDVYFMTDSTGSMSGAITSVQEGVQQIVDELAASGIDAHFGVADFRDYPNAQGNRAADPQATDNYPYQRRRAVGPINSQLADALANISTGGGTADGDDSALEAIYQATTGAGRADPLLLRGNLIAPGQGAQWRKGALKVVLIASDDEMRHPGPPNNPGYPGPSLETVSKALQDNDVHLVGIAVHTGDASARSDMEQLASDSHTVAPANGVDCDGDGVSDLSAGDPIVCGFSPDDGDSIAPVFVGLLEGVRDFADVDVHITGDAAVVHPLRSTHFAKVNVKAPSDFTIPVQFSCDSAHVGTTTPVTISAVSRGTSVISTTATVRCAPIDPPVKPALIPLIPAVVAPAPPPPPAPAGNAQPNPNPNPNPQVNANAGAATNEDEQAQLAMAESDQGEAEGSDELAFSSRRPERAPLPDVAWVGAVMLLSSAAFGTHLARRSARWAQFSHQMSR